MPIFMDVHIVPGVKAEDVAEAHRKDLLHQDEHGCKCMTYWIDEARENIFCLIEAPNKEAVEKMHDHAHGLIPNKVIEVNPALVETFLGRIYDPSNAVTNEDGLKVFADPSFRFLLVTQTQDPVLLHHCLGEEKAKSFLQEYQAIIRKHIVLFGGSEAEHRGEGFIISFSSALRAINCALEIRNKLDKDLREAIDLRMALHAGEPVEKSNTLFGDTIRFANQLCTVASDGRIGISSSVKELLIKDQSVKTGDEVFSLAPNDEELVQQLFSSLEENWQDPEFDAEDFGKNMAMSKSQLYRKAISLTTSSPNQLLKDFRLDRARELMKKNRYNISQITFESGFTSPSYFTKCFKKKYGLLPMEYIDLLH